MQILKLLLYSKWINIKQSVRFNKHAIVKISMKRFVLNFIWLISPEDSFLADHIPRWLVSPGPGWEVVKTLVWIAGTLLTGFLLGQLN